MPIVTMAQYQVKIKAIRTTDTVGIVKNLQTVSKGYDYTAIVFYDPQCEHLSSGDFKNG